VPLATQTSKAPALGLAQWLDPSMAEGITGRITERITVVSCRSWPIVGCGRRLNDDAIVVVANRVVATSSGAEQAGVTVGLRRREAQRRAPDVEVSAPDPAGEARAFSAVLGALDAITPRIEIETPGVCTFLTRGPSRYFGGDHAMSDRVAQQVAEVLDGVTTVHVGTADSRFGAMQAAKIAEADAARVIPAGASATFLAPLPIRCLASDVAPGPLRSSLDDLVDVVTRLGLTTLGSFGELSVNDVSARFGALGVQAHLWANGHDDRLASPTDPPPELEVSIELDPPLVRVDQAAFVARTLADEFIRKLRSHGASCARVAIIAATEHGEEQVRLWRSDEAFSASAIADRMRWQLDGWLAGPLQQRPTGGLSRLALAPDDLSVANGRQLGFWGEQTELGERAARAVARVQGLAGAGVAMVPEVRGDRSPADVVALVPSESVDLVERASAVDRTTLTAAAGDPAAGVRGEQAQLPWLGQLPAPAPSTVHRPPVAVELIDVDHQPITVDGRGVMAGSPAWLIVNGRAPLSIRGWSGVWLLDERWWQPDQHRRKARLQIELDDGRALVIAARAGAWAIEATYD